MLRAIAAGEGVRKHSIILERVDKWTLVRQSDSPIVSRGITDLSHRTFAHGASRVTCSKPVRELFSQRMKSAKASVDLFDLRDRHAP